MQRRARCAALLGLLAAAPSWAERVQFREPTDFGFFALGWSPDGKRFAFGWFETNPIATPRSAIWVVVQDLITDKILFEKTRTWEQGKREPDRTSVFPATAPEAWRLIAQEVTAEVRGLGISDEAARSPSPFPFIDGDEISLDILSDDGTFPYEIWAVSKKLGRKKLASGDKQDLFMGLSTEGYMVGPDRTRLAVVLRFATAPFATHKVIGCHVRVGFKKPPRAAPSP